MRHERDKIRAWLRIIMPRQADGAAVVDLRGLPSPHPSPWKGEGVCAWQELYRADQCEVQLDLTPTLP